ncbi:hypothetical protein JHK87_051982 [Glycine soja]|nr:hypothetical protein JHK87_051982 [Glycine soja]
MASKYHYNKYNNPSYVVVIFIVLCFFSQSALSDPRISEVGHYCSTQKSQTSGDYLPIFTKEMEKLLELVTKQNWGTHSEGMSSTTTTPIYGLAQCFQDLSSIDCLQCFAASRTKLPRCLPSVSARIYLDGCFLRYDNYSFYTENYDPLRDTVNCTSEYGSEGERLVFAESVGKVVESVVRVAVNNNEGRGFFAVGEGGGVYALAQCWKTVGVKGCSDCLRKAENEVKGCLPKREGRALNTGCYLRYSTVKFYNQGGQDGQGDDSSRKRVIIAAGSVLAAAVVVLTLAVSYVAFTKKRRKNNFIEVPPSLKNSSLNYKYETLEKATDYFSSSRKIGQGGSGSVYKGTLPNGNDVWKLYQSNRLGEAVDPGLGEDFPAREASRVFQIGLLCTQASASLRPFMAQVASMLSNSNLDVPIPKQPPFLNSRFLDQTSPLGFSIDSSSLNTFKKIGVSYSPSEFSSTCSLIRPSRSEETIMEA